MAWFSCQRLAVWDYFSGLLTLVWYKTNTQKGEGRFCGVAWLLCVLLFQTLLISEEHLPKQVQEWRKSRVVSGSPTTKKTKRGEATRAVLQPPFGYPWPRHSRRRRGAAATRSTRIATGLVEQQPTKADAT